MSGEAGPPTTVCGTSNEWCGLGSELSGEVKLPPDPAEGGVIVTGVKGGSVVEAAAKAVAFAAADACN